MKQEWSRSMSHSLFRINTSNRGLICHTVTVHQFCLRPPLVLPLNKADVFVHLLSAFSVFFFPLSSNGGSSLHFHDNKTIGLLLKIGEIFIFATCVSFFRPVLSFPVSTAQTVKMEIFGVFIENHLHCLCNMILEEKEGQAVRGILGTSPILVLEIHEWNIQHCIHISSVTFWGFLGYLSRTPFSEDTSQRSIIICWNLSPLLLCWGHPKIA